MQVFSQPVVASSATLPSFQAIKMQPANASVPASDDTGQAKRERKTQTMQGREDAFVILCAGIKAARS